jgi:hypothetical protein
MSLTNLSLAGNNLIIPGAKETLIRDIPAGDGKKDNLFYAVNNTCSPCFLVGKKVFYLFQTCKYNLSIRLGKG